MSVIAKPYTFSPNTTASSSQVNSNFDTLYNDYNGGISAANLATDAVTTAKIADSNVTTAKIADDAVTAAKLDSDATGHGFLEIDRTTLGSAGNTITVSSLPAYKYLRIEYSVVGSGGTVTTVQVRLNNDSGNNYSRRTSVDGGADATVTSSNVLINATAVNAGDVQHGIIEILNIATNEKMATTTICTEGTTGAGTAPTSNITFSKWANTTDQVSRVDIIASANNFATGSEAIVYGHN